MAVIKIKSSSNTVSAIRNYLERDNRQVERSTFNIDDDNTWDKDMVITKMLYEKTNGRQYELIVQSFDNEDDASNYNEKTIHKAGCELAEIFANAGYQVVVITHNDTDNLHNHIIVNTVNSYSGKKIQISNSNNRENAPKSDFLSKDIYKLNDEICKRYGLLTLEESKKKKILREKLNGKQATNYATDEIYIKNSYKEKMRSSLQKIFSDRNIYDSATFYKALEEHKLTITRITATGNITYADQDGHKVRAARLGGFNKSDIEQLFRRNQQEQRIGRELSSRDQLFNKEKKGRSR